MREKTNADTPKYSSADASLSKGIDRTSKITVAAKPQAEEATMNFRNQNGVRVTIGSLEFIAVLQSNGCYASLRGGRMYSLKFLL
jgi:hypothetical protein